jgi:4-hydroxy-2-oxoheptanedioate aldolase
MFCEMTRAQISPEFPNRYHCRAATPALALAERQCDDEKGTPHMAKARNQLKARLSRGDMLFGAWLGTTSAYVADIAGTCGFDWLLIDGEHAPNGLPECVAQLQAIEASESEAVVRLPSDETWLIKQYLDAGAQNLLIPMVNTAEQARRIVAATRYPPQGVRGIGAALARASRFSAIPDYIDTANDEIGVILQIESVEAIENLDEIVAVDGIDCLFIGPADLAADMGHTHNLDAPEVAKVIANALRKISASGIPAGILSLTDEKTVAAKSNGARFIGVGVDVLIYAQAMRALAAKHKE